MSPQSPKYHVSWLVAASGGLLLWASAELPAQAAAAGGTNSAAYIITLKPGVDAPGLAREQKLKPSCFYRHALNGFVATMPAGQAQGLKRDPRILAVEPDGEIRMAGFAPGPLATLPTTNSIIPTGVSRMGIAGFPVAHINGQNHQIDVNVAVLDTGVCTNTTFLNVWTNVECADPDPPDNQTAWDWHGHGTHVAGSIGAKDLGYGLMGVAPGAKIWNVRVLGPTQSTWTNFLAGMDYIVEHADEIEVANASLEGTDGLLEFAVEQAVSNAVAHGIVFVAAAGNDGQDVYGPDGVFGTADDVLPAALPEALTVSAVMPWVSDQAGDPASPNGPAAQVDNGSDADVIHSFSNFSQSVVSNKPVVSPGKAIDLAAPGENIISVYKCSTTYGVILSGTSMAAAHVSGLVALYIAANGRAHNAAEVYRIRQALIDNGLPQSQWRSAPNAGDPDGNPEPMAMASLAWVPPVTMTNLALTPQGFQLSFNAVPGYTHVVQYASSLDCSNQWSYLAAFDGEGSVSNVVVTDTNALASQRFYRVVRQPTP